MTRLNESMIDRAAEFIWMTGGVLDQRRMALFAGQGSATGVLDALRAHSTGDGGYAYAIEPDVKGPVAHPLLVMTALEILDEAGGLEQATAGPICDWLAGVTAPDGGVPNLLPSIRDYPRPPWVDASDEPAGDLLATARITGLLLKHGIEHDWIAGAAAFCRKAIDRIETTHPYEVFSINVFLDGEPDEAYAASVSRRIGTLVRTADLVLIDPANPDSVKPPPGYAEAEHHYPHDFAPSPDSLAANWFSPEEMSDSLDFLSTQQQDDGGWPIHYRIWSDAIEQQARPGFTLQALRILRAWDRSV